MAILVLAEHDDQSVRKATLHTVAAAKKLGGDVHVLVAGHAAGGAAKAAAQIAGVAKVLHADAAHLGEFLTENVAALVVGLAKGYTHVLAPALSSEKIANDRNTPVDKANCNALFSIVLPVSGALLSRTANLAESGGFGTRRRGLDRTFARTCPQRKQEGAASRMRFGMLISTLALRDAVRSWLTPLHLASDSRNRSR